MLNLSTGRLLHDRKNIKYFTGFCLFLENDATITLMLTFHRFFLLTILTFSAVLAVANTGDTKANRNTFNSIASKPSVFIDPSNLETLKEIEYAIDQSKDRVWSLLIPFMKREMPRLNFSLNGRIYELLGDYYRGQNNYLLAIQNWLAARQNYQLCGDTLRMVSVLVSCASINFFAEKYDIALDFYRQAISMSQQFNSSFLEITCNILMGSTYQRLRDFPTAEKFFSNALHVAKRSGLKDQELKIRVEMGRSLMMQDMTDEALVYYQTIIRDTGMVTPMFLAQAYTYLGHLYDFKGDSRNSLACNMKSMELRLLDGENSAYISSRINIAGDYFKLDMADSAFHYLNPAMEASQKRKFNNLLTHGYGHLYRYYERKRQFKQARMAYEQYSRYKELNDTEKRKVFIDLLRKEQELLRKAMLSNRLEKENEIELLKLKNQKFPSDIVTGFAGLALAILVIMLVVFIVRSRISARMHQTNILLQKEAGEKEEKMISIREQEQKFRLLAENSIDMILHFDERLIISYASPSSEKVFGYSAIQMLDKKVPDLFPAESRSEVIGKIKWMQKNRENLQFSVPALNKQGEKHWVEIVANPVFDTVSDNFIGVVAVVRDIDQKKQIQEKIMDGTRQKETLLKEIHHRVKNNFSILISLINMQMAQYDYPELHAPLKNLQLRIRSMGLVHEMLYRSEDFERISIQDYMRSMVAYVSSTMNKRNVNIIFDVAEGFMNIDKAIPIGLILTEVLTNSYRHAFPDGRDGEIEVKLSLHDGIKDHRLLIRDNGTGLPFEYNPDHIQTMGLTIVNLLSGQLDGDLSITSGNGVSVSLDFRLN
jgi:PAS domain S-box-containing protein